MNIIPIKLPDIGEGVTEVELAEWHVKVGDIVKEDDVVAAVMTDKATVEIPSLYSGTVTWISGEVGDTLPVGSDLMHIETYGTVDDANPIDNDQTIPLEALPEDTVPISSLETEKEALGENPKKLDQNDANSDYRHLSGAALPIAPRTEGQAPVASPSVRARARENGIDLRQVAGSGPAGRISHEDLDAVFDRLSPKAGQSSPSCRTVRTGTEKIKVIGMRRKIAEHMALANSRIPHITVVEEIDVTAVEDLRAKLNSERGDKPKLTMLPFIVATLTKAVLDHPEMNAHYLDDDGIIIRHAGVNAGVATMTDNGLVVPVLRHAEALGLFDSAAEIARLAEAARTGKATREELTGSTITITSLGSLGALATTPIINHPEVAILGINKMAVRSMWDSTQFVPRKMMNISASFDHRVIDGWNAAVFVQRIKTLLETPAMIFMEV